MGLFNWGQSQEDKQEYEALKSELATLENRLDAFLAKLNERVDALLSGFIEEAPSVMAEDDRFGQAYYRFSSAMKGQAGSMREKLREVLEKQIEPVYSRYSDTLSAGSEGYSILHEWRHRCARKADEWEEQLQHRVDEATEQVERKDYEPVFAQMMNDYWQQCQLINCRQCGANLNIKQVYYYSAYVACSHCQTQNIFEPGTIARDIEHTARKLAEQRSKHFMDAHERRKREERSLYQQMHELQLTLSMEERVKRSGPKYEQLLSLESKRLQAESEAPELLDRYYRNIFDELTKLLPDLEEHHEKFFKSLQANYQRYESKRSTNL
ncbi:hypothetical protein [Chitinophaga ginsengisoli]|uniref:Uncharacterized protein n=1 Tax=Chitinophaga ginsengisoli TaxID=363837 RepID=A0A2P8GDG9_9BACT|nr:hypothetical protein [Chitinophaga ginsengisoli]PSL32033.1 hypothetical protein CLV42_104336 [Chitinophaga ginsengisoli]